MNVLSASPGSAEFDLTQMFEQSSQVNITEGDRLQLARQILLCLFLMSIGVFGAYMAFPENPATTEIFELIKIGALPVVTLVVSFYFPNSRN